MQFLPALEFRHLGEAGDTAAGSCLQAIVKLQAQEAWMPSGKAVYHNLYTPTNSITANRLRNNIAHDSG